MKVNSTRIATLDSNNVQEALAELPFKFNYIEEYAKQEQLENVMNEIEEKISGNDNIEFLGFDLVTYEFEVPNEDFDMSQFPENVQEYLRENRGQVVEIPMHIVSVFNVDGKTVAGPMFGSSMTEVLQSDLDFSVKRKHVNDRLEEMLNQGLYDEMFVSFPYFGRWVSEEPHYENSGTNIILESSQNYVAGSASTNQGTTLHLLSNDPTNLSSTQLTHVMADVNDVFLKYNKVCNVKPPKKDKQEYINYSKWLVSETTDRELLEIYQGIQSGNISLSEMGEIVDDLTNQGYIVINPADPEKFLKRLEESMSLDVQSRVSYSNPDENDIEQKKAQSKIQCTYVRDIDAKDGDAVNVMVAEDKDGGAALNPYYHTHKSPSFSILLKGNARFGSVSVEEDRYKGEDVRMLLEHNVTDDFTRLETDVKPGSVMIFSEGMAHRFVASDNNPFALLVAQSNKAKANSPDYTAPVKNKLVDQLPVNDIVSVVQESNSQSIQR